MARWWVGVLAAAGAMACFTDAPTTAARRAERDQLRREVAGYRTLAPLAQSGLVLDEREVVISLSDSLVRGLIAAAFPLAVRLPGGVEVTLSSVAVRFQGNVARVEVTGEARRPSVPRVGSAINLRGALDRFDVDSSRVMKARITIDNVDVGSPSGVPGFLEPIAQLVLQRLLERNLDQLVEVLPAVAVPVHFDSEIHLPTLDEVGPLTAREAIAPLAVVGARVAAFQDRLWIVLRVERGAFESPAPQR